MYETNGLFILLLTLSLDLETAYLRKVPVCRSLPLILRGGRGKASPPSMESLLDEHCTMEKLGPIVVPLVTCYPTGSLKGRREGSRRETQGIEVAWGSRGDLEMPCYSSCLDSRQTSKSVILIFTGHF